MIDFTMSDEHADPQVRTRHFIADEIIPMEADPRGHIEGLDEGFRQELTAKAKTAGLLTPQAETHWGGLGLSHVGRAIVFEEAGYSLLGPIAMHIHAPDEGNIHLLEAVGTQAQKQQWLKPMVAAEMRSAFLMTEPDGGAGSDPGNL
ncbi:MAG: acyl-CoA dehydrogenase family protein, partial [Pseudomonadota bacterium]